MHQSVAGSKDSSASLFLSSLHLCFVHPTHQRQIPLSLLMSTIKMEERYYECHEYLPATNILTNSQITFHEPNHPDRGHPQDANPTPRPKNPRPSPFTALQLESQCLPVTVTPEVHYKPAFSPWLISGPIMGHLEEWCKDTPTAPPPFTGAKPNSYLRERAWKTFDHAGREVDLQQFGVA